MIPDLYERTAHARQQQIIGLVGGLGPYAHLALERKLLDAARKLVGADNDQAYPEWILSAAPQTTDRTLAFLGRAASPTPWLVRSIKRLENHTADDGTKVRGADFVVIACNTAHCFLEEVRPHVALPILDMIETTAGAIRQDRPGARVGIMATTGVLMSRIYHNALEGAGQSPVSTLDLEDGEAAQRELVMAALYGPWKDGGHTGGGIKGDGPQPEHAEALEQAAARLVRELRAEVLIAGCTEIPLALTGSETAGVPLVDPMQAVAEAAIVRAYGLADAN